jgi:hypothetical protein
LPLCDDDLAVRAAADQQRSTRNRELNSTKTRVASKAQEWFEKVDALLNRREQLLENVYQDFCGLGDAVLSSAGRSGKRTIARGGPDALAELAGTWCGARDDLAQKWAIRFLDERQIVRRSRTTIFSVGCLALAAVLAIVPDKLSGFGVAQVPDAGALALDDDATNASEPVAEVSSTDGDPVASPEPETIAADVSEPADEDALPPSPWKAWAINPPRLSFAGQSLLLLLECDSPSDGRLHDLELEGLTIRSVNLTNDRTEVRFDVLMLPENHGDGLASWSFELKSEAGLVSERIVGTCQVLSSPR